jgi:hypothetical protein
VGSRRGRQLEGEEETPSIPEVTKRTRKIWILESKNKRQRNKGKNRKRKVKGMEKNRKRRPEEQEYRTGREPEKKEVERRRRRIKMWNRKTRTDNGKKEKTRSGVRG